MEKLRNADLFYGHSMKGKSRAIAELVEHLYAKTGKKSRLYIGDGGVATYENTGLIEAGVLEVVEFSHLPAAMTYLKAMTRGWAPNEEGVWGKPSSDYMTGKSHGLVIFEGATVIKSWLLGDISEKIAKGQKIGGVKDDGGELVTVDEKQEGLPDEWRRHGQVQGLHHGTAYRELERAIRTSTTFSGKVIWTAHPTEAPDFTEGGRSGKHGVITGKKLIGPDVCGKAKAATIGSLFGNCLHFDTAMAKNVRERDDLTGQNISMLEPEYRIYTRSHFDPDGLEMIEFRAGSRSDGLPLYYTHEAPGKAILEFYQDSQQKGTASAERIAQLRAMKKPA